MEFSLHIKPQTCHPFPEGAQSLMALVRGTAHGVFERCFFCKKREKQRLVFAFPGFEIVFYRLTHLLVLAHWLPLFLRRPWVRNLPKASEAPSLSTPRKEGR